MSPPHGIVNQKLLSRRRDLEAMAVFKEGLQAAIGALSLRQAHANSTLSSGDNDTNLKIRRCLISILR